MKNIYLYRFDLECVFPKWCRVTNSKCGVSTHIGHIELLSRGSRIFSSALRKKSKSFSIVDLVAEMFCSHSAVAGFGR